MVSTINVLGIIEGALSLLNFGGTNFVDTKDTTVSTVKVAIGLDTSDGMVHSGGDLPAIRLFNELGVQIAHKLKHKRVDTGVVGTVVVKQHDNAHQQPSYALFTGHRDSICVAYVTITWPDKGEYAWPGDWGRTCGGQWYYSNIHIAPSGHNPDCLWIDNSNQQPQTAFQIHWPEFTEAQNPLPDTREEREAKTRYLCAAGPPFHIYHQPNQKPKTVRFWPPSNKTDPTEMAVQDSDNDIDDVDDDGDGVDADADDDIDPIPPPPNAAGNQTYQTAAKKPVDSILVLSDKKHHSAQELCGSSTAFGPDFFNAHTGIFCRMSDRTLWPVCNTNINVTDMCFSRFDNLLIVHGVFAKDAPYHRILDWTST